MKTKLTFTQKAKLLARLLDLWDEYPDLRFCQLVSNITNKLDIYYVDDRTFEKQMIEFRNFMTKELDKWEKADQF